MALVIRTRPSLASAVRIGSKPLPRVHTVPAVLRGERELVMSRPAPSLILTIACTFGAAACSGGEETATTTADDASTTESAQTTEPVATSTTSPEPVATTPSSTSAPSVTVPVELTVEKTPDLRYGEDRPGFNPPLMDVYAPIEAGPWPPVVLFHGSGGQKHDKAGVEAAANVIAGAVFESSRRHRRRRIATPWVRSRRGCLRSWRCRGSGLRG
jgi:hypothetical protein